MTLTELRIFVGFVGRRVLEAPSRALWGTKEATWRRLIRQGRVVLGPGTYGIPPVNTFIHDDTKLIVGSYCSLGSTFMLGGFHPTDTSTTYPFRINWGMEGAGTDGYPVHTDDTHVGSDCWLGYGAYIMSGIKIGNGAVVATGAVVTKDVPDYAIVGGVPAKIISYRHTEEQRQALLEIAWWDWPEDEIREAVPLLSDKDVDAFIEYARAKGR